MAVFPAGHILTSADFDILFPTGVGAWSTYTPTLTQSATVSKTVTTARYMRIGRLVVAEILLIATSSGTASNAILLGLPVAAANTSGQNIGSVFLFDASVPTGYVGEVVTNGGVASFFLNTSNGAFAGATGGVFTAALTTNDQIRARLQYESAS